MDFISILKGIKIYERKLNNMDSFYMEINYDEFAKTKPLFCKRFGLNAYYSQTLWQKRKIDADFIHKIIKNKVKKHWESKGYIGKPVEISMYWDDRMDIDNHVMIGKMIVDALRGTVIEDDNRKNVKSIHHEFWDKDCIGIIVSKSIDKQTVK